MDLRRVTASLIETVTDQSAWPRALADICQYTRTSNAVVTLRAQSSAAMIIPDAVQEVQQSPLIHGFSQAQVETYLAKHHGSDPWITVARDNHPYSPYAMSKFFPIEKLRGTAFGDWLKEQNIDDTVIVDLGAAGKYWAAMNLYFGDTSTTKAEAICGKVKEILPILRSAWAAGRNIQLERQAARRVEGILEQVAFPVVVVSPDGSILHFNDAAQNLAQSDFGFTLRLGEGLALPASIEIAANSDAAHLNLRRTRAPTSFRGFATTSHLSLAQLISGEPSGSVMIAFFEVGEEGYLPNPKGLDLRALTNREAELARLVAEGSQLKEAREAMGISHARAMQLWRSIRDKMGIRDVADLRVAHRMAGNH